MLFKNISIIYRHSASLFAKTLGEYKLSNTEQSMLLFLLQNNGVNQHAFARYFQFNKATVTKTLSGLEEKALIKREVNCESKREKCVYLTKAGKSVLEEIIHTRKAVADTIMEELTEEEKEKFDVLSERIAAKVWQMTRDKDKGDTQGQKTRGEK